jgi:TusA-related sulfurtransferase
VTDDELTDEPPALRVQMLGRLCPLPVIELARRIEEVPLGAVVLLVSDDPAAASDVAAWCRMRGQDYLGTQPEPVGVGYLVRRRR